MTLDATGTPWYVTATPASGSNPSTYGISRVTPDGASKTVWSDTGGLWLSSSPQSMALAPDGSIWAVGLTNRTADFAIASISSANECDAMRIDHWPGGPTQGWRGFYAVCSWQGRMWVGSCMGYIVSFLL
jgi:hypothetical protein